MDLASARRGRRSGVQVCTNYDSCMRVCFLGIMARPSHPPTHHPPTLDALLSLELTCSTHAVELLHTRPWPGSCCSARHTLDTAGLLARRADDDLPARGESAVGKHSASLAQAHCGPRPPALCAVPQERRRALTMEPCYTNEPYVELHARPDYRKTVVSHCRLPESGAVRQQSKTQIQTLAERYENSVFRLTPWTVICLVATTARCVVRSL